MTIEQELDSGVGAAVKWSDSVLANLAAPPAKAREPEGMTLRLSGKRDKPAGHAVPERSCTERDFQQLHRQREAPSP